MIWRAFACCLPGELGVLLLHLRWDSWHGIISLLSKDLSQPTDSPGPRGSHMSSPRGCQWQSSRSNGTPQVQGKSFQLFSLPKNRAASWGVWGGAAVKSCFSLHPHLLSCAPSVTWNWDSLKDSKQPPKRPNISSSQKWHIKGNTYFDRQGIFCIYKYQHVLLKGKNCVVWIDFCVCLYISMCLCNSVCMCSTCLVVVHQRRLPVSLWALWSHVWLALTQKE